MILRRQFLLPLVLVLPSIGLTQHAFSQASASHIVADVRTGKILLGNRHHEKLPVAGLTTVATACVVLDWLDATGGDRNALVTVPPSALIVGGPNPLGLQAGDQLSIRDALFCMLDASDAICALTLAENIGNQMWSRQGGRATSGMEFFVEQMNALAAARMMSRTLFLDPHGLDAGKKVGYSTAADMANLTIYALKKPSFNFIVNQKTREISYYRGGQKLAFRIHNTNQMLGQMDVNGVKTGRSTRAGECLIISAQRPDRITMIEEGRSLRTPYHLVVVTLGSVDRFGQAQQLIQQGWVAYEQWLAAGLPISPEDRIALPE